LLTRGIIFSSITDQSNSNVTYTVNLSGTQNNTVQGADTAVYVPSGTTTGQFSVNGTLLP